MQVKSKVDETFDKGFEEFKRISETLDKVQKLSDEAA